MANERVRNGWVCKNCGTKNSGKGTRCAVCGHTRGSR